MNTRFLLIALSFAINLFFTSCNKDEDTVSKPVIDLLELGLGNSHAAYIGADLHIEAEIVAEGRIGAVSVEIHMEEGSADEIKVNYDEFAGLKNTTFHKHIDIPAGTEAGTYHVHLTVTDQEGNQTTVEDEISITELVDSEAPAVNVSSAPGNGQIFGSGETISVSGLVTDNISLGGMLVALVREDDNISDEDVTGDNTSVIVMLHTHDFEDPDEYEYNAAIAVGAENDNNMIPALIEGDNAWQSGNYYILIKVVDAKGNWSYSIHYPILINL